MGDSLLEILESGQTLENLPEKLFIFPLTENVIFPDVMMPIVVPPGPMLELVKRAQTHSDYLGFLWGHGDDVSKLKPADLSRVGCVGHIIRMARMPDGAYTMIVHCVSRMRVLSFLKSDRLIAEVEYLRDSEEESDEQKAYYRNIQQSLNKFLDMETPLISRDLLSGMCQIENPGKLADLCAAQFPMANEKRQEILETLDVTKRLATVYEVLVQELELAALGQKIHDQIRERIEKSQKEFFLREQLRAIRKELGEEKDEIALAVQNYRELVEASGMSQEASERAREEIGRLAILTPDSSETNVIRTYLDWLCNLPWRSRTDDILDLKHAERVLDQDHFGLDDIKQRILEFLAVRQLKRDHQGQIICFLGPPGVGKTSLARSINRALNRKFYGISLGGLRDEAEIRGHRRTYVGAMPGKIMQGLKRVGVRNPVIVLDEIDKLGSDWHGDPSSAMLEVLDPSQNMTFHDHYLDVDFDLSDVMFIATANDASTIPRPLLDRMEIIELSGYIDEEKVQIARRHIIPKKLKEHGMERGIMRFTPAGLKKLICGYTREAGVRELERMVAKCCRKTVRSIVEEAEPVRKDAPSYEAAVMASLHTACERHPVVKITPDNISDFLGQPIYTDEVISRTLLPGVSVGLAWTQAGGEILFIETTRMPGCGQLKLTGQLGEVMSESVQIAFSFVRANMGMLRVTEEMFSKSDFHVHFPAGAIPKDGPSAGITITTSILSLLLGESIPERLAMTGEITLTGNVLPVGGIKEKVIAAKRAGARTLVMCLKNRRDVDELAGYIKEGMIFYFVDHYKEVFKFVFTQRCRVDLENLPKHVVYVSKGASKFEKNLHEEQETSGAGEAEDAGVAVDSETALDGDRHHAEVEENGMNPKSKKAAQSRKKTKDEA